MCGLVVMTLMQMGPVAPAQSPQRVRAARPAVKEYVPSAVRHQDMILRWNDHALDAIRAERTPPPVAARNLAIVHVAAYDAVNAIAGTHTPYLVRVRPMPGTSPEAAAVSAAHRTLVALYPRQRDKLDRAMEQSLAGLPDGNGKVFGEDLGRFVADRVLEWRSRDGADRQVAYAPPEAPGVWAQTPPDYAEALLPQWSLVTPFAIDPARWPRPKDPPRLTDATYTTAFKEVKELGAADSRARTPEQDEIAHFWADGPGTCTPPGHWNLIAQTVARERGTTLAQNARLFALLNIALADVGILCWDCKYKTGVWRPVTAIRQADRDGNPNTEADPAWTPLLATPPFPAYTSGHSSFSAAAAAVLSDFFGDNISFRTESESLPGVTRPFESFWAAAAEAGRSRIYGGIHWKFDNAVGLAVGKAVGRYVSRNFLRPVEAEPRIAAAGR